MGIPGFFARMQAAGYAEVAQEIGRPRDYDHTRAIIDAPALAYHVFHSCERLRRHDESTDSQADLITYAECAVAAVQSLKILENYGFIIDAIFFDGALPTSKRDTRIDRLADSAKRLDAYRRLNEKTVVGKSTISVPMNVRRALTELAPPFLVQAVQEALLNSRYKDVTICCPGEADHFCVAAARKACMTDPGGRVAIFTNDSDLAVFDSGRQIRVVLLDTLEPRVDDSGPLMVATVYWPWKIATKIRCPDLIELAFYLSQDPKVSVPKVLARIQPGKLPRDQEFRDFAELYRVEAEPELAGLQLNQAQRQLLLGLDARVAELVHQANAKRGLTQAVDLAMFLPFLTEDSIRASAWRIGCRLRETAYIILLTICDCRNAAILEYKRAGNSISPRKVSRLEFSKLRPMLKRWHYLIKRTFDRTRLRTTVERWRLAVVQCMMWEFVAEDMILPLPEELLSVLKGQPSKHWHAVQLSACFQAAFYSLRMLRQIMRYAQHSDGMGRKEYVHGSKNRFEMLLGVLEGMPSIADFFRPDAEVGDNYRMSTGTTAESSLAISEVATSSGRTVPSATSRQNQPPADTPAQKLMRVKDTEWIPLLEACLQGVDESWAPMREVAKEKKKKSKYKKLAERETGAKKVRRMPSVDEHEENSLAGNPFAALAQE